MLTGEGSLPDDRARALDRYAATTLKPFIFVINNSGYTVERESFWERTPSTTTVANWRYSELPNVFSRDNKAETYVIQTGMVIVELVMGKYDAPIDLIVGGHALADSDYGVPGPQSAPNAQILLPAQ